MLFPFQAVAPDLAGKMRGAGPRMLRAVAVKQRDQVGAVGGAVAGGGIARRLERQKRRLAAMRNGREGARVQLVGEVMAQRVVREVGHGRSLASGRAAALPAVM